MIPQLVTPQKGSSSQESQYQVTEIQVSLFSYLNQLCVSEKVMYQGFSSQLLLPCSPLHWPQLAHLLQRPNWVLNLACPPQVSWCQNHHRFLQREKKQAYRFM